MSWFKNSEAGRKALRKCQENNKKVQKLWEEQAKQTRENVMTAADQNPDILKLIEKIRCFPKKEIVEILARGGDPIVIGNMKKDDVLYWALNWACINYRGRNASARRRKFSQTVLLALEKAVSALKQTHE
eukprot:121647_1